LEEVMTENGLEKNQNRTALIIDDDESSRRLLEDSIAGYGFEMVVCGDGSSAWKFYDEKKPRLIILDWDHPGLNGIELCKKIRQSPEGKYVAILMVSSRGRPEDLEAAIAAGVNHFLSKPLNPGLLNAYLSAVNKNMEHLRELEHSDHKIASYREELETTNDQLQEAITRANQLAMEAELAYLELNQVFKNAADGIRVIDRNQNVLRYNRTFLNIAEVTDDEVLEKKCHETFRCSLCQTDDCPLPQLLNGSNRVVREVSKKKKNGAMAHYIVTSSKFLAPDGDLIGIVEYILDITARVQAEEALKESEKRYRNLSTIDDLTKLYNKRYFKEQLRAEIARAERYKHPLSLLIMDIDDFKHHNDAYGHPEGDKVLARLGRLIRTKIRSTDCACRYGGEEFVVILPYTTGEDAADVAERIRTSLEKEVFYPKPDEPVIKTISIGVTQFIDKEEQSDTVERADQNLYSAKKQGKNRYVLA
jgi:two-component system cell cycle response regulator